MSENGNDRRETADAGGQKSGWWWRFTALLFGAPPIAVYGAEEDVERERAARAGE
ncbi:hypothetical protein ACFT30_09205 [Microbacterium ureisolvens]|uniref:hypothetical protein n=1 Tax=Microbacterium TaxID=33882 RepID=UPI0013A539E7|nr:MULTISPECIES: hypothetical protein [Microbacterium]